MTRSFDTRLHKLEKYAAVVANDERTNPLPMIQAFVDDNGGRSGNESWAGAAARLLGMSSAELMAYLNLRAEGSDL